MIRIFKTEDGVTRQTEETTPGCWISLIDPTATEILEIAERYEIDPDDVKAPLDEEERSRIEIEDELQPDSGGYSCRLRREMKKTGM